MGGGIEVHTEFINLDGSVKLSINYLAKAS